MNIPSAAYRIQFNKDFNFSHLSGIIEYLEELGITAIYASPLLEATPGSMHGYDILNPFKINPDLGTLEEFEALRADLRSRGIGWIQDIVPNHMNFDSRNIWLKDVLERGINSSFAHYFDIDWDHPYYPGKLMVPFLGQHLNECLKQGQLRISLEPAGFYINYFDNSYPVNLENYPVLLSGVFQDESNKANALINALLSNNKSNYDHWLSVKEELLVVMTDPGVPEKIRQKLEQVNADVDVLSRIAHSQHYVLCDYDDSNTQINYRRFFNVNSLICLSVENEQVFNDYHAFMHILYSKGLIDGLRIDHVDGLRDPKVYIDRLRALFGPDCYIIVEKILDIKEEIPVAMDIQGTSGYEFLSYINQVITDRKGSEKLVELYHKYVPEFRDYESLVFEKKLSFLETYLNGEWDNLLRLLLSLNIIDDEEMRTGRLKKAIGIFMAAFPVYRCYVDSLPLSETDEAFVKTAFERSYQKMPELTTELNALREIFRPHEDVTRNANRLAFVQRIMQFTGPLAAKGVEDTVFFLYNPLISHNEVGDQPCVLGIPVQTFHEKMLQRQAKNPLSFNCTSTHDTKRGEDNRMRINIISEVTDEWAALVAQWQKMNEPYRTQLSDVTAPTVNDEYYLYQTLVGGLPEDLVITDVFIERTKTFYIKVLRESKLMSDYINPNEDYENACLRFIDRLFDPAHGFLQTLLPFAKKLIGYANTYIMVQAIIKITAPGIPEVYRGCELWDLSYVDPDNRRPLDFELRKRLLRELKEREDQSHEAVLAYARDHFIEGTQKLYVTHKTLQLRKQFKPVFLQGEYIPLDGPADGRDEGTASSDRTVIAYFRKLANEWILVVLPLGIVAHTGEALTLDLPEDSPKTWTNIFTGEDVSGSSIDVHRLFANFPVAVLRGSVAWPEVVVQ